MKLFYYYNYLSIKNKKMNIQTQQLQSETITKTARTWLGTKFHHQGRIKRSKQNLGGCDCVGLIIGVGNELGIKPHNKSLNEYDTTKYGRIHKRNQLNNAIANCFQATTTISLATILVFQINSDLQHCAIVSEIINSITTANSPTPLGEGARSDGTTTTLKAIPIQPQIKNTIKIIHCDAKARKVVENNLPETWLSKIIGAYNFS